MYTINFRLWDCYHALFTFIKVSSVSCFKQGAFPRTIRWHFCSPKGSKACSVCPHNTEFVPYRHWCVVFHTNMASITEHMFLYFSFPSSSFSSLWSMQCQFRQLPRIHLNSSETQEHIILWTRVSAWPSFRTKANLLTKIQETVFLSHVFVYHISTYKEIITERKPLHNIGACSADVSQGTDVFFKMLPRICANNNLFSSASVFRFTKVNIHLTFSLS